MQNLFERLLVERDITYDDSLNKLATGEVIELEDFEDGLKQAAIDAGFLFWIDGLTGKRFLGSISAWNSFYNTGSTMTEAKKKETQEELINRITDELLTKSQTKSAFSGNTKTYISIDFTTNCPLRKKSKACKYCYVEHSRKITREFVKNLVINNGFTSEDFDAILGKDRDVKKPVYHKDTVNPDKPKDNTKKGDKFKVKKCNTKLLYSDQPYKGEIMRMSQGKIDKLNKMGGARLYSSGDYTNTEWEDEQIAALFTDAEKRNLKIKVITKQPDFIKNWALDENGAPRKAISVINLSVDNVSAYGLESTTIPLEIAKEYKKNYPNVRIRSVALNPKEAVMYVNDPNVDVVTLFHGSAKDTAKEYDNKIEVVNMSPGTKAWKDLMKMLPVNKRKKFCCGYLGQEGIIGKCVGCELRCDSNGCEELPSEEELETIAMECYFKK